MIYFIDYIDSIILNRIIFIGILLLFAVSIYINHITDYIVNDIYYSNTWLTYLFKHKGDYTVELELTDVNGNKNTTNKNILKII